MPGGGRAFVHLYLYQMHRMPNTIAYFNKQVTAQLFEFQGRQNHPIDISAGVVTMYWPALDAQHWSTRQ